MRAPKVGRKLFDKLWRGIHPVGVFELGGEADLLRILETIPCSARGKGKQIREFAFNRLALDGKLEIVFDDFTQQAGHKAQRQPLQRGDVIRDQLPSFRRVAVEMVRFEIAGSIELQQFRYRLALRERQPRIPAWQPSVGTRSVDSVRRS